MIIEIIDERIAEGSSGDNPTDLPPADEDGGLWLLISLGKRSEYDHCFNLTHKRTLLAVYVAHCSLLLESSSKDRSFMSSRLLFLYRGRLFMSERLQLSGITPRSE